MRTGLGGIAWALASLTVFANTKPPVLPGTYEGDLMGTRVGIVGDSVTCLSSQYLTSDFSAQYAFQIRCKNGITITEGTPFATGIQQGIAGPPSVFIVNLGTNDAVRAMHDTATEDANDIAAAQHNLNVLAWDIQHVPCVIWVTVSEVPDALGSHVARAINAWMESRAQTVPGNHVLDWWGLMENPLNAATYLSPYDGVHTTQVGQEELATLYLKAVQQDCASVTGAPATSTSAP